MSKERDSIPIVRRNIAPQARSFRNEGFPDTSGNTDSINRRFSYQSKEALSVWYENKTERNAIIAIIADRIVDRAIDLKDLFPPFGLSEEYYNFFFGLRTRAIDRLERKNMDPYDLVKTGMISTLNIALRKELVQSDRLLKDKASPDPYKSVYSRYKQIINFGHEHFGEQFREDFLIRAGIGTAVRAIVGVTELVPKVYDNQFHGRHPTPEELLVVAQNSYSLAVDLASLHISVFSKVQKSLEEERAGFSFKPFNSNKFTIDNGTNLRLLVNAEIRQMIENLHSLPAKIVASNVATGCPALVNFSGESAIRKVWNWNMEIARILYEKQFGNNSVPRAGVEPA